MKSPGEIRYLLVAILAVAAIMLVSTPAHALTADPMDLSIGARSLGMGNAYVAVAEDSETVFINPAGLGQISSLKLGSMYSNVMEGDLNYAVISGAYPMDNDSGTIGAGFIHQYSDGIEIRSTTFEALKNSSYSSDILFISYGVDLSKKVLPYSKGLYGGYTLKYFMKGASDDSAEDMSGSGFAADAGVIYRPEGSFATYGLSLQNIVAGTMLYKSGEEDEIGSAMKLGTNMSILGDRMDNNSLYQSDSKVNVAADYNIGIRGKVPPTVHVGVEYKPSIGVTYIDKILTLRAGINQVAAPEETFSNITVGLGLNVQGTEFNFAYSPQNGNLPESATSYFSISYIGIPEQKKVIEESKPLLSDVTPDDKIVTTDNTIVVHGKITDISKLLKVEINDAGVVVSQAGTFEMNVPLSSAGKHLITVRATDTKGNAEEHKIRVIRLVKFVDVPDSHWAVTPVQKLATVGLVEGYPDGSFQPERALSRAELATLLVKAKGQEPPIISGRVFKDMAANHWASRYVKGALDMGLVTGYPDKTFKPNNKITRMEGVVVMSRFGELKQATKLEASPYPDLTARNWASPYIAAARDAGYLQYLADQDFQPKKELTRAEAVEILSKTNYGTARIDSLMDWTVGFLPGEKQAPMAVAPGTPVYAQKAPVMKIKEFVDVPDEHFAGESIKYLATAGVLNGFADGSFKPDRIVTRAELSTLLVKAKGDKLPYVTSTGYVDVNRENWAAPYIRAAVDAGYLTGRTNGKFEPNKAATRAEAVAAMVKFGNIELPTSLRTGPFPDMTAREWSSTYVAAAKDAGLVDYLKGQDFEADKAITRGELAEILGKTAFGQEKIKQVKSAASIQQ